jgi:hypothetical protein
LRRTSTSVTLGAANLANISAQFKILDEEIIREEVAANHGSSTAVLPYCDDVASVPNPSNPTQTVQQYHTVAQFHLCARQSDLLRKQDLAYGDLGFWYPNDDRALPAVLAVVRGYVLPVLMGLLGSMTYVLRRYLRNVGDRLLSPRDLRGYVVRLVLGTVFGVAIGFFTSGDGNTAQQVISTPVAHRHLRSWPATPSKPCSACWTV